MISLFKNNKLIFIPSFLISLLLIFSLNYNLKSFLDRAELEKDTTNKHYADIISLRQFNSEYIVLFNIIEIEKVKIKISKDNGYNVYPIQMIYSLLFGILFFIPFILPISFLIVRPWIANVIKKSKINITGASDDIERDKVANLISEMIFALLCFSIFYGLFNYSI